MTTAVHRKKSKLIPKIDYSLESPPATNQPIVIEKLEVRKRGRPKKSESDLKLNRRIKVKIPFKFQPKKAPKPAKTTVQAPNEQNIITKNLTEDVINLDDDYVIDLPKQKVRRKRKRKENVEIVPITDSDKFKKSKNSKQNVSSVSQKVNSKVISIEHKKSREEEISALIKRINKSVEAGTQKFNNSEVVRKKNQETSDDDVIFIPNSFENTKVLSTPKNSETVLKQYTNKATNILVPVSSVSEKDSNDLVTKLKLAEFRIGQYETAVGLLQRRLEVMAAEYTEIKQESENLAAKLEEEIREKERKIVQLESENEQLRSNQIVRSVKAEVRPNISYFGDERILGP